MHRFLAILVVLLSFAVLWPAAAHATLFATGGQVGSVEADDAGGRPKAQVFSPPPGAAAPAAAQPTAPAAAPRAAKPTAAAAKKAPTRVAAGLVTSGSPTPGYPVDLGGGRLAVFKTPRGRELMLAMLSDARNSSFVATVHILVEELNAMGQVHGEQRAQQNHDLHLAVGYAYQLARPEGPGLDPYLDHATASGLKSLFNASRRQTRVYDAPGNFHVFSEDEGQWSLRLTAGPDGPLTVPRGAEVVYYHVLAAGAECDLVVHPQQDALKPFVGFMANAHFTASVDEWEAWQMDPGHDWAATLRQANTGWAGYQVVTVPRAASLVAESTASAAGWAAWQL